MSWEDEFQRRMDVLLETVRVFRGLKNFALIREDPR